MTDTPTSILDRIDLQLVAGSDEVVLTRAEAGITCGPNLNRLPVRLVLDDLLTILRDAGWTDHKNPTLKRTNHG